VSIFDRIRSRLRGKEPDPTIGTQIALVAGAVAVTEVTQGGDSASDFGWSGDHMSGGSDFGGGGGFDGGMGGDMGGGGV